jgi:hypothetical protein
VAMLLKLFGLIEKESPLHKNFMSCMIIMVFDVL